MDSFRKRCLHLRRARWSPPLHSTMEFSAPSQIPSESSTCSGDSTPIRSSGFSSASLPQYKPPPPPQIPTSPSRFHELLQKARSFEILGSVTSIAGSRLVFLGTLALLLVWTILGVVFGATDVWQIVMQRILDSMPRLRYAADATTSKHNALIPRLIAEMRSRSASCLRMVRSLSPPQLQEPKDLQTSKFKKSSSLLTRD